LNSALKIVPCPQLLHKTDRNCDNRKWTDFLYSTHPRQYHNTKNSIILCIHCLIIVSVQYLAEGRTPDSFYHFAVAIPTDTTATVNK